MSEPLSSQQSSHALPSPMLEAESSGLPDEAYRRLAEQLLARIESALDVWLESDVVDIDATRSGSMLEMTLPNGSKLIVNLQPPLKEVWLAARRGGFHYRWTQGQWLDTKSGDEFYAVLSQCASEQAGLTLRFEP